MQQHWHQLPPHCWPREEGLRNAVTVQEVIITPFWFLSNFFFKNNCFINTAVLPIFKNVHCSVVPGWLWDGWCRALYVTRVICFWDDWCTTTLFLFVCHFHLAKIMSDVNVVSWRSPLSFDAGSIQVSICVQVLWTHCVYISIFYNLNLLKYTFVLNSYS